MSKFGALAPAVAVELASHRVSAAALEIRGGRPVVAMHATEALPPGALVPALVGENMPGRSAVASALGRVLEQMGRPRRIGLILPDPVAKISLVRFAQIPARAQDLDQLVRWQVRKATPFPIDEGQVSYVPGVHAADGHEFIVSVARRAVIEEYEAVCAGVGAHAGLVDISTFNVINALLAGSTPPNADWLLVNVATDYTSIAIMRSADLILFRSRGAEGEGSLADLVHQTSMYYEDRLEGAGFARVLLGGAFANLDQTAHAEHVRRSLEERLGTAVEPVDVRGAAALTDRIGASADLVDRLAPLVGLLLRERGAAA
jgi:Tfp pilus assembly PilM family ATPase